MSRLRRYGIYTMKYYSAINKKMNYWYLFTTWTELEGMMLSKICHKENNIFTHTWNKNTLKKGSGKTKPNQTLEANWKIEAINEKSQEKRGRRPKNFGWGQWLYWWWCYTVTYI